ncbi:ATP-binding cassette transporter subfamily A [Apostichopus japonicus]|uniref:ATP-binding cassette transporter subfamily A n=1 Tax=Stichopus japonicus TaxID=307972 RepID=A0A2G8KR63_STIJA|nr:ATP-binding cassette transporter subfamily A [Apostichopus japonicus]
MDPYARRATWELLLKYKEGKTMVLTTHFMDEADLLGDRIAIMANGQLITTGSSLFLKNRFGVGYHLTFVRNESCDVEQLTGFVKKRVPEAHLESCLAREVDYILPIDKTSVFSELFNLLNDKKSELGVDSFGISVTTMEEVFMKVGDLAESTQNPEGADNQAWVKDNGTYSNGKNNHANHNGGATNGDITVTMTSMGVPENEYLTGIVLKLFQFIAIFQKRLICAFRDPKSWILQIVLPLVFVLLGLTVAKTGTRLDADPARELNLANISRVAPNGGAKAFVADLRADRSLNILRYTKIYNSEGQINEVCESYDNFGYNNCPACLLATFADAEDNCTSEPQEYPLTDMTTYFQEYILENSKQADFYFEEYVAGYTIEDAYTVFGTPTSKVKSWYSNQAYHTSPEALNALSNALLKYFTNESFSLSVTNFPLPFATTTQVTNSGVDPDTFNLAILILFGMSFLTASFLPFIVSEKSSKAKHLQLVSGLDRVTYWVANYCWDFVNFLIVFVILLACFAVFQVAALSGPNLGTVAVILLLFGWAAIPFVYLVSTLFKTAVNGYAITTILLAIFGMALYLTVFLVEFLVENKAIGEALDHIFMVLPTYAMVRAIGLLSVNHGVRDTCTISEIQKEICMQANISFEENNYAWDQPGVGQNLVYMTIEGVVFFLLVLLTEFMSFSSIFVSRSHVIMGGQEDEDVAKERRRVHEMNYRSEDQAIVIKDLNKVYFGAERPAVQDLALAIPRGECFGLLGVNGAGKTTTFGMLTGDVRMTSGHAYIQGMSIRSDMRKAQRLMGYCPQFDALVEKLTGRETLTMFARLRGIPAKSIPSVVDSTIEHLDLVKYADKLCGNYSGGNKRKLSTAIAMVGSPPTVLLDEPTSGMDPKARRHLWNAILSVMREGKSVVLTSHSMEECEALCTRLAIMVNGQFKCLGSVQHLKSRFGRGYTMIVKTTGVTQAVQEFILTTFPGATLLEIHQGTLQFQVYDDNMNWSRIFGSLEQSKERLNITDYSVSQTPLEQVFINFAKEQFAETKERKRCCCCYC